MAKDCSLKSNNGQYILQAIIDKLNLDAQIKEVRRGLHWTAVVSRSCGLSSTMTGEHCVHEGVEESPPASFTDMTAMELAQYSYSGDPSKATLGLAAINSLIEADKSKIVSINAGDILLKNGVNKNISVIGHFPFTDALKKVAKNLWVIEKRVIEGDYPEDSAEKYLPQSDIIAISATSLINHTLQNLLELCPKNSMKMLLGPTTPMSEVFFDFGFDIISGSIVTDQNTALKYISEGVNFRQLKKTGAIRLVAMTKEVLHD
uniref:Heavy-metal chelation domain-containing protein n=1 Tax=uncultured Desulfobacterium sp. TaxID=201089 RepID=E1YDW5_9BACT|nr:hypothetical protein N47_L13570 [uncultured Desulfobacterium sp.]